MIEICKKLVFKIHKTMCMQIFNNNLLKFNMLKNEEDTTLIGVFMPKNPLYKNINLSQKSQAADEIL